MFGIWDHLLALTVAALWPGYLALRDYPAFLREVASGDAEARPRAYRKGIWTQWTMVAVTLGIWLVHGRALPGIGLRFDASWQLLVGFGLVGLAWIFLEAQRRTIVNQPGVHDSVRKQLDYAAPLLPHTEREYPGFLALGVTAGICEEILFRGYLMAYAEPWLGIWGAWIATSAIFGAAHLYLGPIPAARAGAVGLIVGGLYLFTGSLWVPMLLHALIDVNAGQIAYTVFGPSAREETPLASNG